jgi:hypothetical protein
MLLLIIVLLLLFGGGGGYYGYSRWGTGGGLGTGPYRLTFSLPLSPLAPFYTVRKSSGPSPFSAPVPPWPLHIGAALPHCE